MTAHIEVREIGGDTYSFKYDPADYHTDFEVDLLIAVDFETQAPVEWERQLSGFVKWDGCSHLYFGEKESPGYLHLCDGARGWKNLAALMEAVYRDIVPLTAKRDPNLLPEWDG
jgi:hypothetical protein